MQAAGHSGIVMSANEILETIAETARQTSWIEYAAVITALVYLALAAFEKVLCWLFGIISSLIYVYLCYSSKLYLETLLQGFYVVMGFYGWLQWEKNKGDQSTAPIRQWKLGRHIMIIIAGGIAGVLLGFIFSSYTEAAQPYFDGLVTGYSLIATWMVTKKLLENWIYWIVIDAASIILYSNRGLYLSGLLFFIFTVVAVGGFFAWKKEQRAASVA